VAEDRPVVVEAAQLTKIFRDFWLRPKAKALDDVNLQIYHGEIFGLLGPNGCGKSTLLKILLGLLFPTKGRVAVFGRDPRNILIKDRIGFMPEESYLYRYLNADETLNFYGRLFNLPRHERRHRVGLLLDMVGMERQRRRPVVEYSRGMARRIGLAQALINDPDLVMLDEPTAGLDPVGTREFKDLILELKRRGKTVILSSHLLADVEDVCDRVAILYGGRLRRMGPVDKLLHDTSVTQITVGRLKPETIEAVLALIRSREGAEKAASVGFPRERLETLFMRVVEEARAAHIETAGTTTGAAASTFFSGIERETKAEEILRQLLASAPAASAREQEAVVLPASEPVPAVEKKLIEELAQPTPGPMSQPEPQPSEPVERPAVVLPAGGETPPERTTDRVLKELLSRDGDSEARKP